MNRMQSQSLYMGLVAVFIGALLLGLLYFIVGIHQVSYLVTDGVNYGVRIIDRPRYDQFLQGLIFTGFFMVAGILFVFVIVIPDARNGMSADGLPPQPQSRRRPPIPLQQPAAAIQAATAPVAPPEPAGQDATISVLDEPADQDSAISVLDEPAEAEPAATPAGPSAAPTPAASSVEEEVLGTSALDEAVLADDLQDSRVEDAGEDDLVYGTGRVTDDSIWEFVLAYPDSAVKFLYRKSLDNKQLSPTDEDIYRRWEQRGMTRAKVREVALDIMGWRSLPDDFPHNIWRELRDQIFEIKTK